MTRIRCRNTSRRGGERRKSRKRRERYLSATFLYRGRRGTVKVNPTPSGKPVGKISTYRFRCTSENCIPTSIRELLSPLFFLSSFSTHPYRSIPIFLLLASLPSYPPSPRYTRCIESVLLARSTKNQPPFVGGVSSISGSEIQEVAFPETGERVGRGGYNFSYSRKYKNNIRDLVGYERAVRPFSFFFIFLFFLSNPGNLRR